MMILIIYFLAFSMYTYNLIDRIAERENKQVKTVDIVNFLITTFLFEILGLLLVSFVI